MELSLTIIMPAYKEAGNIKTACESATRAVAEAGIVDYEILIISNLDQRGDHDGTPDIAAQIAKSDPRVRSIHNQAYVGLGYKYRQGVSEATKDYVMLVPGDGEFEEGSLAGIMAHIGEAEIIVPYHANPGVRGFKRRFVSRGFTVLCNLLFGLNLKYYNGLCIHPRRYLQKVPMASDNFAYMAEVLVYLVKSGVSYLEVPWEIKPSVASTAFRLKSVIEASGTLLSLFWKIHFQRERITVVPTA